MLCFNKKLGKHDEIRFIFEPRLKLFFELPRTIQNGKPQRSCLALQMSQSINDDKMRPGHIYKGKCSSCNVGRSASQVRLGSVRLGLVRLGLVMSG